MNSFNMEGKFPVLREFSGAKKGRNESLKIFQKRVLKSRRQGVARAWRGRGAGVARAFPVPPGLTRRTLDSVVAQRYPYARNQ